MANEHKIGANPDKMHEFGLACDKMRTVLERLTPSDFRRNDPQEPMPADPFMLRMAAAGYRAIATELENVAKSHEQL